MCSAAEGRCSESPELRNAAPGTQEMANSFTARVSRSQMPKIDVSLCHKIITFVPVPGKCEDFREELNKKIRNLAASTITWNKTFCDENMTSCISGLIVTHFWSYRHAFLVLSSPSPIHKQVWAQDLLVGISDVGISHVGISHI